MSERDSTPSSDNNNDSNTHEYFVPIVMLIVLSIVIVATFYDKELDNLFASNQAGDDTMAILKQPAVKPKTLDASDIAAGPTATAEKSNDDTAAPVVVAHASDPADTIPPPSSLTAYNNDAGSDKTRIVHSTNEQAAYTDINDPFLPADTPTTRHASSAGHRQAYNQMMDERRRLYEDAIQSRRAHMVKMREYRTEVMKRIEQDRKDLYNFRKNSGQQKWNRPYQLRYRPEQTRTESVKIPI